MRLCRSKNRQTAVRLPGIRRLRIAITISSSVKSGCSATRASSHPACSSNGDLLPPLGFALAVPVSCQRRHHLTAELGLSLSPLPVELNEVTISLLWHASYDRDPAHIWLRELVTQLAAEL